MNLAKSITWNLKNTCEAAPVARLKKTCTDIISVSGLGVPINGMNLLQHSCLKTFSPSHSATDGDDRKRGWNEDSFKSFFNLWQTGSSCLFPQNNSHTHTHKMTIRVDIIGTATINYSKQTLPSWWWWWCGGTCVKTCCRFGVEKVHLWSLENIVKMKKCFDQKYR